MSTGTICLLISAGIMIIVTVYLDIVGEQVAEIKEIAEEQGWADPAKIQQLGERPRSRAAHRRVRPAPRRQRWTQSISPCRTARK